MLDKLFYVPLVSTLSNLLDVPFHEKMIKTLQPVLSKPLYKKQISRIAKLVIVLSLSIALYYGRMQTRCSTRY